MSAEKRDYTMTFFGSGLKELKRFIRYQLNDGGTGKDMGLTLALKVTASLLYNFARWKVSCIFYEPVGVKYTCSAVLDVMENGTETDKLEMKGGHGIYARDRVYVDKALIGSTYTAAPTSGAWKEGDLVPNADIGSDVLGWRCRTGGTFGGTTHIGWAILGVGFDYVYHNSDNVTGIAVGDYITIPFGFPDATKAKRILGIDGVSATRKVFVDSISNAAARSDCDITYADPVFDAIRITPDLSGTGSRLVQASSTGLLSASIGILTASGTWDPGNMAADGDATATTITVTGAAVGNQVSASLTTIGANNVLISAHVQAADTVRVTLLNKTGGALDIASGTLAVKVWA